MKNVWNVFVLVSDADYPLTSLGVYSTSTKAIKVFNKYFGDVVGSMDDKVAALPTHSGSDKSFSFYRVSDRKKAKTVVGMMYRVAIDVPCWINP